MPDRNFLQKKGGGGIAQHTSQRKSVEETLRFANRLLSGLTSILERPLQLSRNSFGFVLFFP